MTLEYADVFVHTILIMLSVIFDAVNVYDASANQSYADVCPSKYPLPPRSVPVNAVTVMVDMFARLFGV